MNECEIVGCCHDSEHNHTGLCKEHETDMTYWLAQKEPTDNKSIRTYIHQKNRELLG